MVTSPHAARKGHPEKFVALDGRPRLYRITVMPHPRPEYTPPSHSEVESTLRGLTLLERGEWRWLMRRAQVEAPPGGLLLKHTYTHTHTHTQARTHARSHTHTHTWANKGAYAGGGVFRAAAPRGLRPEEFV